MKKILTILLVSCLFCNACTNLPGLKRKSAQNLYQTVQEGAGRYYNAEDGHNRNVKIIFDKENGTVQIKIPVNYQENVQAIPKKIPEALAERIKDINFNEVPICNNCTLTEKELIIEKNYNQASVAGCILGSILVTPLMPIGALVCLADNSGECSLTNPYREVCSSNIDTDNNTIELLNTKSLQLYFKRHLENSDDLGLNVELHISPRSLSLKCDKKSCQVVDEKGKIVNNIFIKKIISVNQKKINQLLQQEAEKKRQDEIKWQRLQRQQKKECPGLIRLLDQAQKGYIYLDPTQRYQTAQRFQALQCDLWLQWELRGWN